MHIRTVVALGGLSSAALVANAGVVTSWLNAVDGSYSVGVNWSTGLAPGSMSDVLLGLSGAYTVSISGGQSAGTLSISNPDASIALPGNSTLGIYGDVASDGTILVNSNNSTSTTTLEFFAPASVSGSGRFVLAGSFSRARLRGFVGPLTQGSSHSITGFGQIEAELVNNGLVSADIAGQQLILNSLNKINNATMEAVNGGQLAVSSADITQGAAGVVRADGKGSTVNLSSTSIIGGDLLTTGGGLVFLSSPSTLTGVDFDGQMNIPGNNTLSISGSLNNDGVILLNSNNSTSTTGIDVLDNSNFSGAGEIVMAGSNSRARIRTIGATLTNTSAHMIHGFGQIDAAFVNNGTVTADVNSQQLFLLTNPKTNNADMLASGGGILDVNGITLTQGGSGAIEAQAGSTVELTSSSVIGGSLSSSGDGTVEILGSSTLTGVDFEGQMNIPGSHTLSISGSLVNDGVVTINSNGSTSTTSVVILDDLTISGQGEFDMTEALSRSRVISFNDAVLTQAAGHAMRGQGQIEAQLINNGLVRADLDGAKLYLVTSPKVNHALMESINGGILEASSVSITQSAAGMMKTDGEDSKINLTNTTVVGGALESSNDAGVEIFGSSTLSGVAFAGRMDIPGNNTLNVQSDAINNGLITVNSNSSTSTTSLIFADASELGGSGTIRLPQTGPRARLFSAGEATLGAGQRLEGIGQIQTTLLHKGTTAPGLEGVGTMTASQPVEFAGSSVFEAEVNGSTADLFSSSSTVELSGELQVEFVDGFNPTGYWSRQIMQGSSISGAFDSVSVPNAPAGFVTRVYNNGTSVVVGQTCPSDQNVDGMLNFFDVSAFLAAFNAQDPSADIDNNNQFNFFDVSAFLNDFGAACPL